MNYHSWWLAETTDGLYAASGAPHRARGRRRRQPHVGQELDVQVTRALTPQLQLAAGYAHMFPGAFLEAGDARAPPTAARTSWPPTSSWLSR